MKPSTVITLLWEVLGFGSPEVRVFGVQWLYYTVDGDTQCKWLQGFEIEADSNNSVCALRLDCDNAIVRTFTFTHNGRRVATFPLDMPVICHTVRLVRVSPVIPIVRQWLCRQRSRMA